MSRQAGAASVVMLAAARKYQRVVQVGLQRRSTPHIIEARDNIIREGKLGDYYMTQHVNLSSAMTAGAHTVRLEAPSSKGGLELDYLVIHSKMDQ